MLCFEMFTNNYETLHKYCNIAEFENFEDKYNWKQFVVANFKVSIEHNNMW